MGQKAELEGTDDKNKICLHCENPGRRDHGACNCQHTKPANDIVSRKIVLHGQLQVV